MADLQQEFGALIDRYVTPSSGFDDYVRMHVACYMALLRMDMGITLTHKFSRKQMEVGLSRLDENTRRLWEQIQPDGVMVYLPFAELSRTQKTELMRRADAIHTNA